MGSSLPNLFSTVKKVNTTITKLDSVVAMTEHKDLRLINQKTQNRLIGADIGFFSKKIFNDFERLVPYA